MSWRGETEDGIGWGGLVPSKAERDEERRAAKIAAELVRLRSDKADLLEALSLLLLETEDYPELMPQTLRQARAAIAKATK